MPYSSSSLHTEYISDPLILEEALLVNIGEYTPALLELDVELVELALVEELLVDSSELLLELLLLVADALEELEPCELGVLALLDLSLSGCTGSSCSVRLYRVKKYLIVHFPALSLTLSLKWSFFFSGNSRQSPSL